MKHITVIFKNAIQIEGNLLSLDDNEMILQSIDGLISTVIPDVKESILFYKVNSSQELYDDLSNKSNKTQEDLEQLTKTKGNLNDIERKSLRERIMSPIVPVVKKEQYVSRNQPFPRSIKYSETQTERTNNTFTSGLQGMFSKKY